MAPGDSLTVIRPERQPGRVTALPEPRRGAPLTRRLADAEQLPVTPGCSRKALAVLPYTILLHPGLQVTSQKAIPWHGSLACTGVGLEYYMIWAVRVAYRCAAPGRIVKYGTREAAVPRRKPVGEAMIPTNEAPRGLSGFGGED